MASLQEQLLKAGIVDKKQASKLDREKRKEAKSLPKGQTRVDEAKAQASRSRAEKAERDRELNRQQKVLAEEKAIRAQVVQLITMNRIERLAGDVPYQFADGRKIKKIHVTPQLLNDLSRGRVAIAKLGEGYELVPAAAARKIMQRDEQVIVLLNTSQQQDADENDPYAGYEVPDDLMW